MQPFRNMLTVGLYEAALNVYSYVNRQIGVEIKDAADSELYSHIEILRGEAKQYFQPVDLQKRRAAKNASSLGQNSILVTRRYINAGAENVSGRGGNCSLCPLPPGLCLW